MDIEKIWRGDSGLAVTYWFYGVIGSALFGIPFSLVTPGSGPAIITVLLFSAYFILVSVGIWRAAGKYQGPKIWTFFPKLSVALPAAAVVIGIAVAIISSVQDKENGSKLVAATGAPTLPAAPVSETPVVMPFQATEQLNPISEKNIQSMWKLVIDTKDWAVLVELIERKGNLVHIRRITNLHYPEGKTAIDSDGKSQIWRSATTSMQFDCVSKKERIAYTHFHPEPMREGGTFLGPQQSPFTWDYISPGSTSDVLLKYVCEKF